MKTTLDLPDELIRAAKLRTVAQGRTLRDLVPTFFVRGWAWRRQGHQRSRRQTPWSKLGPSGLPVIRCRPGAPATQMSAQDLLRLEQLTQTEEDMRHAGLSV